MLQKNIILKDFQIFLVKYNNIEYLASFDKKHVDRLCDLGIKRVESLEEIL